ncbi:phosphotransferase enzyme family protein [Mariprofundus micogutta]|uniref:Phosphotransferase enzyme family protein n=1 Tax=Mariprofundus micogutta TaxID=1921010 RepID=A0A1L8CK00_9PROT|nr:AAA family ATPase [Mariprofundus micogutta]GAV19248.1 phosphotransferase enzyme family protein [Mariprofundus micogutta]
MSELPEHVRCFYSADFYPHPVKQIELIQTHISWVFLTGNFAYKIKKPVDFGFLDFTTIEQRKYYCERELQLNRRLSPEIYLDILPINRAKQTYRLHGDGMPIDYCLKMKQFDQSNLFDQQLASGTFDPAWLDQLACKIAQFHRQEKTVSEQTINHLSLLNEHIRTNLSVAREYTGRVITQDMSQQLSNYAEQAGLQLASQLMERQESGFVRHCHGDLHLRNITLIDHQPYLFDCIEFNDEFSIIDVMNDVAFLVMDLDAHKRPDLAMRLLSRYLEQSADYAGLILLRYYLYYRACVRGKVACLLAGELELSEQESQFKEARAYFTLAASYTASVRPRLFAVGGLSGSGKSHLALLGCGVEQAIIIRSDATRKRIAADHPELELYGREMHINTHKTMFDAARISLHAGFSVILDATFLHPDSRKGVAALAAACKAPLHFYWLDIDESVLRERIDKRQKAANDISDADLKVLELQLAEYKKPTEAWVHFLHSSHSWPCIT